MIDPVNALVANQERLNAHTEYRKQLIKQAIEEGYAISGIADALGESRDSFRMYCKRHKLYTPRTYVRSGA